MSTPDHDRALTDDLVVLLPAPPAPLPTLQAQQRIAARLDVQLRRDSATRRRRERHSSLMPAAVVVACVASVAAWSVMAVQGPPMSEPVDRARPVSAAPEAVTVLQLASSAALTGGSGGPEVDADQFAYTRSIVISNEGAYGEGPVLGEPHKREIWMSQDPGSVEEIGIIREFGQDWPLDAAAPVPPSVVRPTYAWLGALPTDPDELLDEIERDVTIGDANGDRDQVVFNRIGTLVVEGLVPPETTAALFEAVTRIPGVEVDANVTDALGRTGIGVARGDATLRSVWVFDPRTYEVLGTRDYFVLPGRDVLFGASAVLERRVVDRIGAMPDGSPA